MSWYKNLFILPLAILAQLAGPQTASADVWRLLPQAQVDGTGIFLDQVVAMPGAGRAIPHLRIAGAPQPSQPSSFSRSQIALLARLAGAAPLATNWEGATTIHVSRQLRAFEDPELTQLLTATLQKEYVKNQGELELGLTKPWASVQVPDEPLTLKIKQMPANGISPAFIMTFELWDGWERVGSWQVVAHAAVWRDIPVAHSALTRGETLKGADLTMERADVLVERDAFLNFPIVNDSLELSENIQVGHPILNRMVRVHPLVLRGQLVEGVFQDGSLGISLMVETLEDGILGQVVRVRNPLTKRELYGKVESEKSVRINL
jgi:flagella basal body P-ring formation protein FlgA